MNPFNGDLLNFSSQFSKTVTKIKEAISNLPLATADDDKEEAELLTATESPASETGTETKEDNVLADPFGLDDLFANESKKHEKSRAKEVSNLNKKEEEDESKRFMILQREALLKCLEIAAKRYRIPWLVFHDFFLQSCHTFIYCYDPYQI